MTNVEKFKKGIVVYQSETDGDYILELWGASTKHPDSIFRFSEFEKQKYMPEEYQIFQWLLECASKLTWPFHAKALAEYALANYYNWC